MNCLSLNSKIKADINAQLKHPSTKRGFYTTSLNIFVNCSYKNKAVMIPHERYLNVQKMLKRLNIRAG